ncbi:hypothetical protein C1H46_045760 [Malus baccata]|uniref:Uncharacterized protein n=1 Tax=Malus baccata TaxID=106549 RepID=A0A540K367_MALBA|nr:hypothetical protein C1H46_045760 [Malus baccata]
MPPQPRPRRRADWSTATLSNQAILMLRICTCLYDGRCACACHGTRRCKMLSHLCKQGGIECFVSKESKLHERICKMPSMFAKIHSPFPNLSYIALPFEKKVKHSKQGPHHKTMFFRHRKISKIKRP